MRDDDLRRGREHRLVRLVQAENDLDLPALIELFPHPRYELVGSSRVYDGIDAVAAHLRERRNAFPDYRADLIDLHHGDHAVIAEAWFSGTHLGRIEDVEPTGRAFRCRMAVFYLFEGPTPTCERIYFDRATIARQLA